MKNFRILVITLLAAFAITGSGALFSRGGGHGYHHGGGHWGGRGYWGGYGWGGYGWPGYYGPYVGLGWGWPGYAYPTKTFAKDNAGQTYWIIYNNSDQRLRIKSDRDETSLAPGAAKKLYRNRSFVIRVYYKDEMRTIKTREHDVSVYLNELGVPRFDL